MDLIIEPDQVTWGRYGRGTDFYKAKFIRIDNPSRSMYDSLIRILLDKDLNGLY
jgi:hypothetical protein